MKSITLFFLLLISVQSVFSQTDKKPGTSNSEIIQANVPDPAITEIVKNITTARENNNVVSKLYWEARLNEITKPQIIDASPIAFNSKKGEESQSSSQIINLSTLTQRKILANAISRDRVSGDIYAAIGFYGTEILPDTLKIFRSSNNGITFSLLLTYTSAAMSIVSNSIDIEAVSKGDSSYAFVTMSHTSPTNTYSAVLRVRQDGGMQSGILLPSTTTKKYTNLRLTSDNAMFIFDAYIYISATLDSIGGGGRRLRSKLLRLTSPFAPGLISVTSGYQNAVTGQYGYLVTDAAPDSAKFETDIAFVNGTNSTPYLCTVTIVRGVPSAFGNGSNLYFTRDQSLGSTVPSLFFSTGEVTPHLKENPRFASTGFLDNSAIVATRSLYAGEDWDPFYFYTSDITNDAPVFTNGYVHTFETTTMGVSVAANYRVKGSYLFAFNEKSGPNTADVFIRPFKNGVLGGFTSMVQVNPENIPASNSFGAPDAGFRNVNNDSCLVIWGGSQGIGSYLSGGCEGQIIGIHSSNTPANGYHLSQNYPNPFNPTTNINYELPVKGFVTLKIYDILGTEVAQLVNGVQQAGYYSVDFNAASLSSGTYFYKLTADKFSDVKRMVVVK